MISTCFFLFFFFLSLKLPLNTENVQPQICEQVAVFLEIAATNVVANEAKTATSPVSLQLLSIRLMKAWLEAGADGLLVGLGASVARFSPPFWTLSALMSDLGAADALWVGNSCQLVGLAVTPLAGLLADGVESTELSTRFRSHPATPNASLGVSLGGFVFRIQQAASPSFHSGSYFPCCFPQHTSNPGPCPKTWRGLTGKAANDTT